MTTDATITLVVLAGMIVLLVTEWLPPGITGLLTIAALATGGVLGTNEAFAGLMNPAVITVGCMYVLTAAVERTGAAAMVADRIAAGEKATPMRAYIGILLITMLLSGFVNNTPLVLIFMPLVLGLAPRIGDPPSQLLIPLSFVSILGGACTLIGTSTNLIVASSLSEISGGTLELGMFAFAPLGAILALSGGAIILLFRKRLLPKRASLDLMTQRGVAVEYMTEIEIQAGSAFLGKCLQMVEEEGLLGEGLTILEVVRDEVIRMPRPDARLQEGDLLLVKGSPEAVFKLRQAEVSRMQGAETVRGVAHTLFEVVVTPDSDWVGRRVSELDLRDRYDAGVFALQRHGSHLREEIGQLQLHAGDVLLLQGSDNAIRKLHASSDLLVVEGVDQIASDTRRAPLAVLALGMFVLLAITKLLPIELAALVAALFVVLTNCLSSTKAYESVSWDVLFLVAGTLALGRAFESTGLAESTAQLVVGVTEPFGMHATLGALLVFAAMLTQVLSNNATAAVMTPIAYQLGSAVEGVGPLPFVMAVAFGANCSFLTPVSFKTNLIVYGPGGYRFRDFLRPGIPITIVYLLLASLLLPVFY